jgi:hypothetical protein
VVKQASSKSQVPLIERWNGHGWSTDRGAGGSGHLAGVSCAWSGSCVAVGSLAEGWSGHRWSAQRLPPDLGGDLGPVSCSSPTACTAAGSGSSITRMALDADPGQVVHWNGRHWAIVHTLWSTPTTLNALNGVSCTARPRVWSWAR